jgi:hypothetical protein
LNNFDRILLQSGSVTKTDNKFEKLARNEILVMKEVKYILKANGMI